MTSKDELEARIGDAWKKHYGSENEAAVELFRRLAEEYPDHVDALWGLGLAYRKAGNNDQALEVFHRVKELVETPIERGSEDFERFFMLKRMVNQQIEQINDFLP